MNDVEQIMAVRKLTQPFTIKPRLRVEHGIWVIEYTTYTPRPLFAAAKLVLHHYTNGNYKTRRIM